MQYPGPPNVAVQALGRSGSAATAKAESPATAGWAAEDIPRDAIRPDSLDQRVGSIDAETASLVAEYLYLLKVDHASGWIILGWRHHQLEILLTGRAVHYQAGCRLGIFTASPVNDVDELAFSSLKIGVLTNLS